MKKAVIYARFSSDNQRDESIDAQVRACQDYAEKHDLEVIKIYADKAQSATSDKRPEFLRMMNDAEDGIFEAVIIHKLDRFSRDRYDHAYYKRKLKRCGIRLCSVLENLDDSPESIILESVLEGMSEYYSKNLARETMKGLRETALQCKHTGGIPPLGYDLASDNTYIVNEHEAEAVKIIFTMYANGEGYSKIIDRLNSLGYKTKRGTSFGKNSLSDILRNEKYIGNFIYNRSASYGRSGPRNTHANKADEEIIRIPGGIPAIIDTDLFYKVQNKKRTNVGRPGAGKAKHDYLLSGKVVCGKCGGSMVGESARNKKGSYDYFYVCATRKRKRTCDKRAVASHRVESTVIEYLENEVFSEKKLPEVAQKLFDSQEKSKAEISDSQKFLKSKLTDVSAKIDNIMQAIESGIFTTTTKGRLVELETLKNELLEELHKSENESNRDIMPLENIVASLKKYQNLSTLPTSTQREAIEIFVDKVICYDDSADVTINLNIILHNKNSEYPSDLPAREGSERYSDVSGGAEGNRTPVRKPVHISFSECSRFVKIPLPRRQPTGYAARYPLIQSCVRGRSARSFTTNRRPIRGRGTPR